MADQVRQAFIGVGANLGDRWATIHEALTALAREPGIATVEASAVYETAPVGVLDQPKFLNLVLGIETILTPERLLAVLHALEKAAGRKREREEPNRMDAARRQLPHPRPGGLERPQERARSEADAETGRRAEDRPLERADDESGVLGVPARLVGEPRRRLLLRLHDQRAVTTKCPRRFWAQEASSCPVANGRSLP